MQNEMLVHISEVRRGLKCGCICPGCGEKMIARKGEKKTHHFSHQSTECAYGLETTLHMMAKAILEQEKRVLLPKTVIPFHRYQGSPVISEAVMVEFDDVVLEKRLTDIIPDVLIKAREKTLFIEIRVSHKIDEEKQKKIKDAGISTLEIDLSKIDRMVSYEELRQILLEETECKHWIYNQLVEYYKEQWISICERKEISYKKRFSHGDVFCSVSNRNSAVKDCYYGGDYFMQVICYEGYDGYKPAWKEGVYCCAKTGVRTFSDLKRYIREHKL